MAFEMTNFSMTWRASFERLNCISKPPSESHWNEHMHSRLFGVALGLFHDSAYWRLHQLALTWAVDTRST